jgi:hypothetical protein
MWRSGAGLGSAPGGTASRQCGIGAREKNSARPAASSTTLTMFA